MSPAPPTPTAAYGPDQWARRWTEKAGALSRIDWRRFRRDPVLMEGIQVDPDRLNTFLAACEANGVPDHLMEDSHVGDPAGKHTAHGFVTAHSLRTALFAHRLIGAWRRPRGPRLRSVLEIGGGFGSFVRALHRGAGVTVATLIDAPPLVELQARYLEDTCPTLTVQAWDPAQRYDLVVNTFSFGEMLGSEVARYFRLIQEQIVDSGVFLSVNRLHRVTSFADYPYDGKWLHDATTDVPGFSGAPAVQCMSVRDRWVQSPHPVSQLSMVGRGE